MQNEIESMICENFFNMRQPGRREKLRINERGFTVTELLVAISIIAVLAAVAIPSYSTLVPTYRLKAAARTIYSDMQKARLQAIKENTFVSLSFTEVVYPADGGGYTVFTDDGAGAGVAGNGVRDGSEVLLWSYAMEKQISLINAAFGAASSVTYTPKGVIAGSQSGNVTIRNNQRWHKITVAAGGGLRLEISSDGVAWSL
ncbi:MAG: GspH/FimT family pseudopilin [Thermodesulfobacteriota bacterium]